MTREVTQPAQNVIWHLKQAACDSGLNGVKAGHLTADLLSSSGWPLSSSHTAVHVSHAFLWDRQPREDMDSLPLPQCRTAPRFQNHPAATGWDECVRGHLLGASAWGTCSAAPSHSSHADSHPHASLDNSSSRPQVLKAGQKSRPHQKQQDQCAANACALRAWGVCRNDRMDGQGCAPRKIHRHAA